jgi:hypothetical protein
MTSCKQPNEFFAGLRIKRSVEVLIWLLLSCVLIAPISIAQPASQRVGAKVEPDLNRAAGLVACPSQEWTRLEIANPGFELPGTASTPAPGWSTGQHVGVLAYSMSVDENIRSEGKRSFRITRFAEQAFGSVGQSLKLAAGIKKVRITAKLRAENADGDGWVLFANANGRLGILDQYRSDPFFGSKDWALAAVEFDVDPMTIDLKIGGLLLGGGTGWIDDVSVCVR